ncbi:MAG TPA: DUF4126 domain-containing protein, partial [Cellvibrionaceae bacterium]|nr:DUF4126 domain-containing protein [Cellvibrionaceae bacterium]
AWASGINVYAVLLVLGLSGGFNYLLLPDGLEVLTHPLVIMFFGFMYCVEFVTDKIPGVDSLWDFVHTFIRIPVAAFLVGALFEGVYPDWQLVAQTLAVVLALSSHISKASSRLLINTSPEPFSNWAASCGEDILVFIALWLAFAHPVVFCLVLLGFVALIIWLLPKIIRLLVAVIVKLRNWLTSSNLAT